MMLQASLTVVAQQGTPDDLFAATADFCHLADNYLRSLWRSIRHKQNLSIFGEVQTALETCADIIEQSRSRSLPTLKALAHCNGRARDGALALLEDASTWPEYSQGAGFQQGQRRAMLDRIERWDHEYHRLSRATACPTGPGLLPSALVIPAMPNATAAAIDGDDNAMVVDDAMDATDNESDIEDTEAPMAVSLRERIHGSSAYKELDGLIGLSSVKQHLRLLVSQVTLAQAEGRPGDMPNLHILFSGNPGTGKTSVARLFGRLLKDLGLLAKGHVVEASRSDLVAEYLGQSEKLTRDKIEAARGGVLFVDEAHQLVRKGSHHDYGIDVIQTLVPAMENLRGELVVIFACYANEQAAFLRLDSGLSDRISAQIAFPDYSNAELAEVLITMAAARRYSVTPHLAEQVSTALGKKRNSHGFGNARLVRRNLESAIALRSQRIIETDRHGWFDRDDTGHNILRAEDFSCLGPIHAGLAPGEDKRP